MIIGLLSLYSPKYPSTVIYMLQSCEYRAWPFLKWYWQTNNFLKVSNRRQLKQTRAARMLLLVMYGGLLAELLLGLFLLFVWWQQNAYGYWEFGLALILLAPVLWAHLILLPLLAGRILIIKPKTYILVKRSEAIFKNHRGARVAVTGSYGKTSMKELLTTVLSTGLKVAATPGNKNVPISHARFAKSLAGNEDVLIIEYGEGAPGDVLKFATVTHPTHAVITGLAPAHLDHYHSTDEAGEDIFTVAEIVKGHKAYVNGESALTKPFLKKRYEVYDRSGALGWKVGSIDNSITGISFKLKKGKDTIQISSGLIGKHQIGPLSFVAAFGQQMGLSIEQVESGIAETSPFEHRMQPYQLGGAWIIDDTYNGNIEGIRAGTELLKELSANRKIYVTPGLVDQGLETKNVHETMGKLIAAARPDIVVLMQNSVSSIIKDSLLKAGFSGQLIIEDDPLKFYNNLSLFVAAGDIVLMQNDWPDNYS